MIGLRVVRGPAWKWDDQDGGEGHVGTIVEEEGPKMPKKTVVVQWDCGKRTNYCVGYKGLYDLYILDSAPAGVKHESTSCQGCNEIMIRGTRWQCTYCSNYHLCTSCYMAAKHNNRHSFYRYDKPMATPVLVEARADSNVVIESRGFYRGARVVRGNDWEWGNQDGGHQTGTIVEIRDLANGGARSVAVVKWDTNPQNIYRIGGNGKVDLKCVKPGRGMLYYRDHLAVCGKTDGYSDSALTSCATKSRFKAGDNVRVTLEADLLQTLLNNHGGWNPKMARLIGKPGKVHRITERGDIRVEYNERNSRGKMERWTFHPEALELVSNPSDSDMLSSCSIEGSSLHSSNSHSSLQAEDDSTFSEIADLAIADTNNLGGNRPSLIPPLSSSGGSNFVEGMIRLLRSGDSFAVRQLNRRRLRECVNQCHEGMSALHAAALSGNHSVLSYLLGEGGNVELLDAKGEPPLFYSVRGRSVETTMVLLKRGANPNMADKQGRTLLHHAVTQGVVDIVRLLLEYGANVNSQNKLGNTPAHCSVATGNEEVTELIFDHPNIVFSVFNTNGCNVLHLAAINGRDRGVDTILSKEFNLMDVVTKNGDNSSSLHLAVQGEHIDVVRSLVNKGCGLNLLNSRRQTSLHLACLQQNVGIIEMLVQNGADLTLRDENGLSCIQIAIQQHSFSSKGFSSLPTSMHWMKIKKVISNHGLTSTKDDSSLYISCYLAINGAPVDDVTAHRWRGCLLECHLLHVSYVRSCQISSDSRLASSSRLCKSEEEWRKLERENEKLREDTLCSICMERNKNTAPPCGHVSCRECISKLITCPVCRKPFTDDQLLTLF